MDTRRNPTTVAANIRSAAAVAGHPASTLAEAADIAPSGFNTRLNSGDLLISDLVQVGGFLRVPTARFFEGVA